MRKAILTLVGGIVIGFAVAHFAFGPIDWSGVREQTGEVVSDAATAEHLVQATKFPPIGNRGMDGAGLDGDHQRLWDVGHDVVGSNEVDIVTALILQFERDPGKFINRNRCT